MRLRAGLATPYVVGLILLVGVPSVAALALAFTEYTGLQSPEFVGLDNFQRLMNDGLFWRSFVNSLIFIVLFVPLRVGGAVGAALLLHRRSRASSVGRPVAYLPTVMPDVA